jgi:hypothetical protein
MAFVVIAARFVLPSCWAASPSCSSCAHLFPDWGPIKRYGLVAGI